MEIKCLFFVLAITLVVSGCSNRLKSAIRQTDTVTGQQFELDTLLSKMQARFDLVIGYSSKPEREFPIQYYLIAISKKSQVGYNYKYNKFATTRKDLYSLDSIKISDIDLDSILLRYNKDSKRLLKHVENENTVYCTDLKNKVNCNINDAATFTFYAITNKNAKKSPFYAPDFFEECCPGNQDRRAFLGLYSQINKLFGK